MHKIWALAVVIAACALPAFATRTGQLTYTITESDGRTTTTTVNTNPRSRVSQRILSAVNNTGYPNYTEIFFPAFTPTHRFQMATGSEPPASVGLEGPLVPGRYCTLPRTFEMEIDQSTTFLVPVPQTMAGPMGAEPCVNGDIGEVNVTRADFIRNTNPGPSSVSWLRDFAATFNYRCVEGNGRAYSIAGSITYTDDFSERLASGHPADAFVARNAPADVLPSTFGCTTADDGPDGDDTPPPPPPPPPFQFVLSGDFYIAPVLLTNASSTTVNFDTAIDPSFDSDVHLSVVSNAPEGSGFEVSVTPNFIPAPGRGSGQITVRTGPTTFPRDYTVTLLATAGSNVYGSSFVVRVDCAPPFILGIDQPKSVGVVASGTQTTLEVKPHGSGPFFYQWYRGMPGMTNTPVQAENNAKLVLTARETGPYWVRVRNACGSVDSAAVMVTVAPQPVSMRRGARP